MLRIKMPDKADQAENGVEAKGLMQQEQNGTAPTRPSGAVRNTMAIADRERV